MLAQLALGAAALAAVYVGLKLVRRLTRPRMAVVGSRPRHRFRRPLFHGEGIRSLADLSGKPTVVEFWSPG